jgi:hypothetical protein
MMHKLNFVAALKVGGKVLRESGGQVELPFGSEYSVLLKNLNSVRAQAKITIDGKDAGPWYVLGPNESMEVERFNTSGNQDRGNRFKFIERTEAVERGRGIQLEDGLIRIEFKKEKVFEAPKITEHHTYHHHCDYWPHCPYIVPVPTWPKYPWHEPHITWSGMPALNGGTASQHSSFLGAAQCNNDSVERGPITRSLHASSGRIHVQNFMMKSTELNNDAGITVPGSESNQKFVTVSDFSTEQSEVITLKLIGYLGKIKVVRPRTVDVKPRCSTCTKVNKPNAKFCMECGTALEII